VPVKKLAWPHSQWTAFISAPIKTTSDNRVCNRHPVFTEVEVMFFSIDYYSAFEAFFSRVTAQNRVVSMRLWPVCKDTHWWRCMCVCLGDIQCWLHFCPFVV